MLFACVIFPIFLFSYFMKTMRIILCAHVLPSYRIRPFLLFKHLSRDLNYYVNAIIGSRCHPNFCTCARRIDESSDAIFFRFLFFFSSAPNATEGYA